MKKLNKKGFTLIELLAVIVILAIIVVVTVPTIIKTIADARVQSIWNLAGEVANSYNTAAAQDLLSPGTALQGLSATKDWKCISSITKTTGEGSNAVTVKLADILELKSNDVVIEVTGGAVNTTDLTKSTCSAIRLKNDGAGGAEVFLLATTTGKFNVSGKRVYALSSADNGVQADIVVAGS